MPSNYTRSCNPNSYKLAEDRVRAKFPDLQYGSSGWHRAFAVQWKKV